LLDALHEQEKLTTVLKTAVIASGGQGGAMEAAEAGSMTRWTTEEDLSTENILQHKACSIASFTEGERIGLHIHLFGCVKKCQSFL
jgi:hypothetical protein